MSVAFQQGHRIVGVGRGVGVRQLYMVVTDASSAVGARDRIEVSDLVELFVHACGVVDDDLAANGRSGRSSPHAALPLDGGQHLSEGSFVHAEADRRVRWTRASAELEREDRAHEGLVQRRQKGWLPL